MTNLFVPEAAQARFEPDQSLVIDTLELAEKLLQNDGWCQGAGHKSELINGELVEVAHCMVGAVTRAASQVEQANNLPVINGLWGRAMSTVQEVTPGGIAPLYNDADGRTFEEVLDVMHLATDRARGLR